MHILVSVGTVKAYLQIGEILPLCDFLPCDCEAYAQSCYQHLSVRPSVCLSNACIVTKRKHLYSLRRKCSTKNLVFSDISFMAIFAEATENERIIDRHLNDIHPLLDYDASESQSMISI